MNERMNGSGFWAFVCGPSGAGKDSVIDCARTALESERHVVFARRMVTRAAGPGSEHDEISRAEFTRLCERDELAWHWEANGHGYGIARTYAREVDEGRVVVVNGSREHALSIPRLPWIRIAHVTAPQPVVQQRLVSRAREDAAAIGERLARNDRLSVFCADLTIDNGGALAAAGATLSHWLLALAHQRA